MLGLITQKLVESVHSPMLAAAIYKALLSSFPLSKVCWLMNPRPDVLSRSHLQLD